MRLGVLETPDFQRLIADKRIERAPVVEVFKQQPREVILAVLVRLAEQAPGYIFNAFVFTYGTTVLGASRNLLRRVWLSPQFSAPFGCRLPALYPIASVADRFMLPVAYPWRCLSSSISPFSTARCPASSSSPSRFPSSRS
jgi:hypothetical protein